MLSHGLEDLLAIGLLVLPLFIMFENTLKFVIKMASLVWLSQRAYVTLLDCGLLSPWVLFPSLAQTVEVLLPRLRTLLVWRWLAWAEDSSMMSLLFVLWSVVFKARFTLLDRECGVVMLLETYWVHLVLLACMFQVRRCSLLEWHVNLVVVRVQSSH